ncbi:MAG: DUF5906 domain-containing protein [Clostridiales bacterium]|nr:DUF5906 domain-containing protein [Clostridiales bacterium]
MIDNQDSQEESKTKNDISSSKETLDQRIPKYMDNNLLDPSFFEGISLDPELMTEIQQGLLITRVLKPIVRHCKPMGGFIFFTGKRWEQDDIRARSVFTSFGMEQYDQAKKRMDEHDKKVERRKLEVAKAIRNRTFDEEKNALALQEEKAEKAEAKAFLSMAKKMCTFAGIEHAMKDAIHRILAQPEEFDADPFLLNTPAGTIDLRTGESRPHNPADLITKMTAVSPSDIGMDKWRTFMSQLTRDDKELELFMQSIAGMCLMGRIDNEMMVLALGPGSSGKSTYLNSQQMVLGDYSGLLSSEVMLLGGKKYRGPELATLKGERLVLMYEFGSERRLDADALKMLVSANDIHGDAKYCPPIDFKPSHTIILHTNNYIRNLDNDTERRILVLPFRASFVGQGVILNYGRVLFEDAGGAVLSWMLEGTRRYIAQNFSLGQLPKCVAEENEAWVPKNEWLSEFIETCCDCSPELFAKASDLFAAYQDYARSKGETAKSQNELSAGLLSLGYTKTRKSTGKIYMGLELKSL